MGLCQTEIRLLYWCNKCRVKQESYEIIQESDSGSENLSFIERNGGTVLLFDGFQYAKSAEYKNLISRWSCCKKRKNRCKGAAFVKGNRVCKVVPHNVCIKDEPANLIAKAFYNLREKICYGDFISVGEEYRKTVKDLEEAGVENSAIPKFPSVKNQLYAARGMDYQESMGWSENMYFIQRKRGVILLHDGFQYTKQKDYKNLQSRWSCVKRRSGCTGVVNVDANKAIIKHPHSMCKKDEETNLVAKTFYELREKISYGDISSVPEEYRKTVEALKNAGINESTIPSFGSVKHRLYNARPMSSSVLEFME